jgi:hypothetical protein
MAGAQGQRGSFGNRDGGGLSGLDIDRLKELVRQLERNRAGDARNEITRGPAGPPDGPRPGPRDFRGGSGGPDGFDGGPRGPAGRWDTRRSPRGPDFRRFPDRFNDLERKVDRILQELEDIRRELRRR